MGKIWVSTLSLTVVDFGFVEFGLDGSAGGSGTRRKQEDLRKNSGGFFSLQGNCVFGSSNFNYY